MKKRIMAAVLAAAMTLSLGACSGSGQTQGAGSNQAEDAEAVRLRMPEAARPGIQTAAGPDGRI